MDKGSEEKGLATFVAVDQDSSLSEAFFHHELPR